MKEKYYMLETNEDKTADLYIFGDITSHDWYEGDVSANTLLKQLKELDVDSINVHINSYGGEVSQGLAIYNMLKDSKMKVTTVCEGFACSAASVVFMAGDERIIKDASLLMIHNAWTWARGDSNELRKQAEDLEKITQASVNAYKSKVNISEEKIKELMDKESWITADEAVEYGFATKTETTADGDVNQSAFGSIREKLLRKEIAPAQMTGILEAAEIDVESLAEKITEKLKPLLQEKKESKQKDTTGWECFFNGKKGE